MREQYGTVRVSTAYGFYEAVVKHMIFHPQTYQQRAKQPFEATGYKTYYVAANDADEIGKEGIYFTLNRREMWNCSTLKGSKSKYEFVGLPLTPTYGNQISMRFLPCPCEQCHQSNYVACSNRHIVENMATLEMNPIEGVNCPDFLDVPLDANYTNAVLTEFIKLHSDNHKVPPHCTNKASLIRYITTNLGQFVNFGVNNNIQLDPTG